MQTSTKLIFENIAFTFTTPEYINILTELLVTTRNCQRSAT